MRRLSGGQCSCAKTANDHCKIVPPSTIRHQFSEHRAAGVPGVQILGVLYIYIATLVEIDRLDLEKGKKIRDFTI